MDRIKLAETPGNSSDTAFEQAFSSLAYSAVQDRAPRLLDYLIGFQLVERDDDQTRAVGVFGCKIAGGWVLVPVFFLNGRLKGDDMMYLQTYDLIVPLTEKWVNRLIARQTPVLGEAEADTRDRRFTQGPDLLPLSTPPHAQKYASAEELTEAGWDEAYTNFLPFAAAVKYGQGERLYAKFAEFTPHDAVERLLRIDPSMCAMAAEIMSEYPGIAQKFAEYHGSDAIKSALLDLREQYLKKAADAPDENSVLTPTATDKTASAPEAVVEILTDPTTMFTKSASVLRDEQRTEIYRRGYCVHDTRDQTKLASVWKKPEYDDTAEEHEFTQATEPGIYNVLMEDGTMKKLILLRRGRPFRRERLRSAGESAFRGWVILSPDKKVTYELRTGSDPIVRKPMTFDSIDAGLVGGIESFTAWWDKLPKTTATSESVGRILCIDRSGKCYEECCAKHVKHNARPGSGFVVVDTTLHVPDGWKAIVTPRGSGDYDTRIGDIDTLAERERKQHRPVKLASDSVDVWIDNKRCDSRLGALRTLLCDYNLPSDAAHNLLKQADAAAVVGRSVTARLVAPITEKAAAGGYPTELQRGAMTSPQFPDEQTGQFDTGRNQLSVLEQTETNTPLDNQPEPFQPSQEPGMPDQQSMQVAQQAARMGQRDLFDVSMLTGLLRSARWQSLSNQYVSDLITALDVLGRTRLLFYWRNDEFATRYGKSDMPELEDTLRNGFELMGDLILFLKEKDVNLLSMGDPADDLAELGGAAG